MLLVPAKFAGVAARKLGTPSVVGEIFVGVVMGPTMIGWLPSESASPEVYQTLLQLAQIGLCLLLFRIGLETDISKFTVVWKSAAGVAVAGMLFPFVLGMMVALGLGWGMAVSAFVGATLTATSIGVTVSVMEELGIHSRPEGQIVLGAAVLDDIFGLLLLSGIIAMVIPGESVILSIMQSLGLSVLFLGFSVWLGPLLVNGFLRLSKWAGCSSMLLVLAFAYLILMAWAAHAIGLAMVIGAYAAGLAFGGHDEDEKLDRELSPLINLITPLFFIMIGASINLSGFNPMTEEGRGLWIAFVLIFSVAIAGKLFSAIFLRGRMNWLTIGSGMLPRGEVGFVFVQIGLSLGLLKADAYSVMTLVLVATTVLGPILLRYFWEIKLPEYTLN